MGSDPRWVDPLTDPRWPALVETHPRASIFHSRGWLEALKRTYQYEPTALVIEDSQGDIASAIVFCGVRSWLTGRRLVSLPFSDHCDPLIDNDDDGDRFVAALNRERGGWEYVEIRARRGFRNREGLAPAVQYQLHLLTLDRDPESLLVRFHKNHVVRKIRRSERERLVYEEGGSEALLQAFYGLVVKTRRRQRLPPQPIAWFRAVLSCLPGIVKIRLALKDGTPIAGIMSIAGRQTMVYKYGASDARFHSLGGMQMLLWKVVQDACQARCEMLDLGRSRVDSVGEAVYKDRWGATRSPLVYWRQPAAGREGRLERLGETVAGQVFKWMPTPLLVASGRGLYRHWG